MSRHGKWLDIAVSTGPDDDRSHAHLVFHLARAGWLRWYDEVPATNPRPSPKSPLALRVSTDAGGFDLTEAGTRRKLAVYVVADPAEVPMVATLGPDPLSEDFTVDVLQGLLTRKNQQVKGLLRDQATIAGIGNAYSDEILHVARISPFAQTKAIAADPECSGACTTPSARRCARRSRRRRAAGQASSRTPSDPACGCTAAPARHVRCAATSVGRSAAPTPSLQSAPPAEPAGDGSSPTGADVDGCVNVAPGCSRLVPRPLLGCGSRPRRGPGRTHGGPDRCRSGPTPGRARSPPAAAPRAPVLGDLAARERARAIASRSRSDRR